MILSPGTHSWWITIVWMSNCRTNMLYFLTQDNHHQGIEFLLFLPFQQSCASVYLTATWRMGCILVLFRDQNALTDMINWYNTSFFFTSIILLHILSVFLLFFCLDIDCAVSVWLWRAEFFVSVEWQTFWNFCLCPGLIKTPQQLVLRASRFKHMLDDKKKKTFSHSYSSAVLKCNSPKLLGFTPPQYSTTPITIYSYMHPFNLCLLISFFICSIKSLGIQKYCIFVTLCIAIALWWRGLPTANGNLVNIKTWNCMVSLHFLKTIKITVFFL